MVPLLQMSHFSVVHPVPTIYAQGCERMKMEWQVSTRIWNYVVGLLRACLV